MGAGATLRVLDDASLAEACARAEGFRAHPGDALPPGRGGYSIRLGPYAVARLDSLVAETR
jgi:hypothetical protein